MTFYCLERTKGGRKSEKEGVKIGGKMEGKGRHKEKVGEKRQRKEKKKKGRTKGRVGRNHQTRQLNKTKSEDASIEIKTESEDASRQDKFFHSCNETLRKFLKCNS